MQFSDEEASEETPVSACGTTLGVVTTVRVICALGVSNFINFVKSRMAEESSDSEAKKLKKLVIMDAFNMALDAF